MKDNSIEARIQYFADKLHMRMIEIDEKIHLKGSAEEKKLMAMSGQVEELLDLFQEMFSDILCVEEK